LPSREKQTERFHRVASLLCSSRKASGKQVVANSPHHA